MTNKMQRILAFIFGIFFLIVLLILAIIFPDPTPFQYIVFKTVLSIAVAGFIAMVPGFLEVSISNWLRAGGALAFAVIVYFYNPADLIIPPVDPTEPFDILLVCKSQNQVTYDSYSFPYADVNKNDSYRKITKLIEQLSKQSCDQRKSKIFRMKDEKTVDDGGLVTATSNRNLGIIVIPTDVIEQLGGNHLAFTKIYSLYRAQKK